VALIDSLKYVIDADTQRAEGNVNRLIAAARKLESLEQYAKKLETGSAKSAEGLAKFQAASAGVARARTEFQLLSQSISKTPGGLEKLRGLFASGLGIGASVAAAQTLLAVVSQIGTVAVDQIGKAIGAASSLEQAAGSTRAVFGQASVEVKAFGKDAAESVGLSNAAFQQQSAVIGALLQNLGFTQDAAAGLSIELVKAGSDLGATFGRSTADAVLGIGALLRGEYDTIEKFGVKVKQADIDARVIKLGLDTSTQALKNNAQATAALAIFQEQASKSAGAFGDKQNTLLGQQQRFNAELENLRAELGEAFLPAMTDLVRVGRDAIPVIAQIAENIGFVAEKAEDALGPVRGLIDLLPDLPDIGLPDFKDSGGDLEDTNKRLADLGDELDAAGVSLERFSSLSASELRAVDDAFVASGLSAQDFVTSAFDAGIERLPPVFRDIARELLGVGEAADTAARPIESVIRDLTSIGDTLFGSERAATSFNKAIADTSSGASARSQAKAYETALRRIEDAQRGIIDAQESLAGAELERFLVSLGASSDEVTTAQIAERNSTRALAEAKLQLIDAQERLNDIQSGGAAASRLEAQAAVLDAQKALAEANSSGDLSGIAKARAAAIRAQQELNRTSSASQATQLARAQDAVAAAQDGVTTAAIDQRSAQRELNDTLQRGKEGSQELRDADRELEDAHRRLEDAVRGLDDAQDGLIDALDRTSSAGKTASERFDDGVKSADAWIKFLIDNKASPDEFAKAIGEISKGLQGVATEAGKTGPLDGYLTKLKELAGEYERLGGFGSKVASGIVAKGGTSATSSANAAEQRLNLNLYIGGRPVLDAVLEANTAAGSPIVTTTGRGG